MADTTVKRIRIYKSFGGQGKRGQYSNTYHVTGAEDLTDASYRTTVQALVNVEQNMASDKVFFDRAVISTVTPKAEVGGADKPLVIPLGVYGKRPLQTAAGDALVQVLPPECVMVINFGGTLGKPGRHQYRHAILNQDWQSAGGTIALEEPIVTAYNNLWNNYFQQSNAPHPLVLISPTSTGLPTFPVLSATVGGVGNRQLTQKRGKKSDFDVKKADAPQMAQDEMAQVIEVMSDMEVSRHTTQGSALFNNAAVMAGIASLAAIAGRIIAEKNGNDYGPPALPVGP